MELYTVYIMHEHGSGSDILTFPFLDKYHADICEAILKSHVMKCERFDMDFVPNKFSETLLNDMWIEYTGNNMINHVNKKWIKYGKKIREKEMYYDGVPKIFIRKNKIYSCDD